MMARIAAARIDDDARSTTCRMTVSASMPADSTEAAGRPSAANSAPRARFGGR